ncbi:MAG: hypothetical protein ACMUIU_08785 [bacterium]
MKNPERLINNLFLRILVNHIGFKMSRFIMLKWILPSILHEKMIDKMAGQVTGYFKTFFPSLSDEEVERKVDEFLWHYKYKFCEDCIVLNLNFDKSLKLIDKYTMIEGRENLLKAMDSGQGILAVGSHVGSILFGSITLFSIYRNIPKENYQKIKICTEPDVPRFPTAFQRLEEALKRFQLDISFINTRRHKSDVGWEMSNALKAGYLVTTNLDVLTGGGSRKQFRLFDSVQVYLPAIAGSVKLALLTGAVILPWHNVRDKDGRLRLTIEEPIGPFPVPEGQIDDQYPEFINLCEKLRDILEGWIKENPEQWTYWDRLHLRLAKNEGL